MSVSSPDPTTSTNTFGAGSTTNTTNSTNSSTGTDSSSGTAATSNGAPSESDFLQLMMDQLKNQDPLNPADPTQYMSELASFSSLDEEMQIASSASETAGDQSASSALNLLGKSVTYTDANGNPQSGTVSAIDFTPSGPTLTIGSATGITLSQITGASSDTTSGTTSS